MYLNEFKLNPILSKLHPIRITPSDPKYGPSMILYTSDNIQNICSKKIEHSGKYKQVSNTIMKLINSNKIIIGYSDPSTFKFILTRIKRKLRINKSSFYLGFYDHVYDSIFILLDNSVNIFGNDIYELEETIVHECCHMASYKNSKTNLLDNTFNDILYPFYGNMFSMILQYFKLIQNAKKFYSDKNVKNIVYNFCNALIKNEKKDSRSKSIINAIKIYNFTYTEFIKLYNLNIEKDDLIHFTVNLFLSSPRHIDPYIYNILESIYTNVFKYTDINNNVYQELIACSEVISTISQHKPTNGIFNSINKLI